MFAKVGGVFGKIRWCVVEGQRGVLEGQRVV